MYRLIRNLLFLLPAETAHHFTTKSLHWLFKLPFIRKTVEEKLTLDHLALERKVAGLTFKNPIGLAAGFDKNGAFTDELEAMGFGFIEIGTVTPKAQPGNPRPRLFRLKKDRALINRMGFNNEGLEQVIHNLKSRSGGVVIGGNIGKNKSTPNEEAISDYLKCFDGLYPYVDYFVVNVSSPNTPGLRELQEKKPLLELMRKVLELNASKSLSKPVFLKIAPDLTNNQLDDILEIAGQLKLDGLIATNTTIERSNLQTEAKTLEALGAGGLSGAPLTERSNEVIRYIRRKNKSIPIIGVGGIMTAEDALAKLDAGANLVQVYTGFIYEGPGLIHQINRAILNKS